MTSVGEEMNCGIRFVLWRCHIILSCDEYSVTSSQTTTNGPVKAGEEPNSQDTLKTFILAALPSDKHTPGLQPRRVGNRTDAVQSASSLYSKPVEETSKKSAAQEEKCRPSSSSPTSMNTSPDDYRTQCLETRTQKDSMLLSPASANRAKGRFLRALLGESVMELQSRISAQYDGRRLCKLHLMFLLLGLCT